MASLKSVITDSLVPLQQQLEQVVAAQAAIVAKFEAIETDIATIKTSQLAIQQFIGGEDTWATPEQLNALGQRIGDLTKQVKSFDSNATK